MNQQDAAKAYSLPYTVKATWSPFVIFSVLGVLISFPLLSIIGRGPSALLPIIVVLSMIWLSIGIMLLIIGSQKIVLLQDRICYHTLFSRKEMLFSEIRRIELEAIRGRGSGYILQIYSKISDKPLQISVKPFSKRDLSKVVDILAIYAPSARLDQSASQLREGTFRG